MKTLRFTTTIRAPRARVWQTMLDPLTYTQWTRAFSPNSQYAGDWVQGSAILFTDPNLGGTKAVVEAIRPYEGIFLRHVAVIGLDGSEDTQSEVAKKWVGATEQYQLTESNGMTTLVVEMESHPEFEDMFATSWPKALALLKELCECGE